MLCDPILKTSSWAQLIPKPWAHLKQIPIPITQNFWPNTQVFDLRFDPFPFSHDPSTHPNTWPDTREPNPNPNLTRVHPACWLDLLTELLIDSLNEPLTVNRIVDLWLFIVDCWPLTVDRWLWPLIVDRRIWLWLLLWSLTFLINFDLIFFDILILNSQSVLSISNLNALFYY